MKLKKILVSIPTASHIETETVEAIINAILFAKNDPRIGEISFYVQRGYSIEQNRNEIAKRAVAFEFDYVFMVDSDTPVPENAIVRLFEELEKDSRIGAATGWQYRKRATDGGTEVFIEDGEQNYIARYKDFEIQQMTGPTEIKGMGFGVTMISVPKIFEMFKKGITPFKFVIYDMFKKGARLSEDLYFCQQMKRVLGYKLIVVPDVKAGHVWKTIA